MHFPFSRDQELPEVPADPTAVQSGVRPEELEKLVCARPVDFHLVEKRKFDAESMHKVQNQRALPRLLPHKLITGKA